MTGGGKQRHQADTLSFTLISDASLRASAHMMPSSSSRSLQVYEQPCICHMSYTKELVELVEMIIAMIPAAIATIQQSNCIFLVLSSQ